MTTNQADATSFPEPPITQWQVRIVKDGSTTRSDIVNLFDKLGSIVSDMVEQAADEDADEVIVEGRRRMNDYVGSPIWSEWEQVQA